MDGITPPPPPPTVTHIISHIISAQAGPDQTLGAANNAKPIPDQQTDTPGQTMNGGSKPDIDIDIESLKDCQTSDPLTSICEYTSEAATIDKIDKIDGINAPPPPPTITPITSAPADQGQTSEVEQTKKKNVRTKTGRTLSMLQKFSIYLFLLKVS